MGREIPAPGPSTRIQPPLKYGSNATWHLFIYPPPAASVLRFVAEALSADEGGFAIAMAMLRLFISDEWFMMVIGGLFSLS